MGGYIIAGVIGLLVLTQIGVIVYGRVRRKWRRRAQVKEVLDAFVVFNDGWRLEDDRPHGWPAAVGELDGRRILIEGFGEDPDIALRVQFAVDVPPFAWVKLTPRENLQMDPLAYEPELEQLFVTRQRPEEWFDVLLEEDALLPFKIEGALEPLFEEQGMLPSFLELDGDGRLFTLQHVKISLTVHELQTAVNMMLAVAQAVETFEFYE